MSKEVTLNAAPIELALFAVAFPIVPANTLGQRNKPGPLRLTCGRIGQTERVTSW